MRGWSLGRLLIGLNNGDYAYAIHLSALISNCMFLILHVMVLALFVRTKWFRANCPP